MLQMKKSAGAILGRAILPPLMLLVSACNGGGGGITPPDGTDSATRRAIEQTIALVERAVNTEDPVLASNQISEIMSLDGLVAFRFRRANAPAQPTANLDQKSFVSLLNDFNRDNENIDFELRVSNVVRNGDLATADLEFHLSATYAREAPPINYFVDALDRATFERDLGAWKLIGWEEIEEVQSGDEDNPGNLEPIVAVNRAIQDLAQIVNTRDFKNQARVISGLFSMNPVVGKRFKTATTVGGGNPPSGFSNFFSEVFRDNDNIVFSLTVSAYDIEENIATVTAEFSLLATYIIAIPPQVYDATATDQFILRKEDDGFWRIISWTEAPSSAPEPSAEDLCRLAVLNLQESIRGKDLSLLGTALADGFSLHTGIGRRFLTHVTDGGGEPSTSFNSTISLFFSETVNVDFQLLLTNFEQNGDVATGELGFNLNATYILSVPPRTYTVTETGDRIQFLRSPDGVWQIFLWLPHEEKPDDAGAINAMLTALGDAIQDRDSAAASAMFHPDFSLEPQIALLFKTHHTEEDPPGAVFADHLNTFLSENVNLQVSVIPDESATELIGELAEIAYARAEITISGDYIAEWPLQHFENSAQTEFDLIKTSNKWQIRNWRIATE
ncbi:MAG: hypothetical protein HRF49_00070 [bacterium]|jgi:hypothetical protein